jgi:dihydropteroate synthase
MVWRIRAREMDVSRALVMGILNVTPDSFSDGGRFRASDAAAARAERMVAEGADLIDIGGESTRPGAAPVAEAEECARVVPAVRAVAALGVPVSVDTAKASVAEAALEAGAAVINDVTALGDPGMGRVVAASGAGLVLMHMLGTPRSMQKDPNYDDVAVEVAAFLNERRDRAEDLGVGRDRIVLDPGIGFGKTLRHNLELLARLEVLTALGSPVLVGASRKRFLGTLTGVEAAERRLSGSLAAAVAARLGGAVVFRVHDVGPTREALAVIEGILDAREPKASKSSGGG